MEPKVKRTKTPQQATTALMNLCARAERSSGDALRLMRGWGVSDADAREVLARLQRERFIDDSRYAAAFVRDKMRLAGWGAYKVATALRAKGVSRDIIEEALREVGDDEVRERLITLLMRRARRLRGVRRPILGPSCCALQQAVATTTLLLANVWNALLRPMMWSRCFNLTNALFVGEVPL